jgi:hypothetical protein
MSADRKFRMPASVIILDLIGTLLLLVGGFDLMNAPLMGPVSQLAAGYGWPLVIAGGLSMLLGAGLFVSSWLATAIRAAIRGSTCHPDRRPSRPLITPLRHSGAPGNPALYRRKRRRLTSCCLEMP